ncbi:MAG TPA: SIR2 family protein [Thermoanaerobaculia bacterium]|nr:SIR2 family protein [Thermoanaerobaculia bacterium]
MIDFGAHKLPPPPGAPREDWVRHRQDMLSRVLNMGTTIAVVGSGCTAPLGYPTWQEFTKGLVEAIAAALLTLPPKERTRREIERFNGFRDSLGAPGPVSSDSLMFYISASQQVLETETWQKNPYHEYVKNLFAPRSTPTGDGNPCDVLLRLPIRRFITTNYDCEVEQALSRVRSVQPWKLGLRPWPEDEAPNEAYLSFTQEEEFASRHITFALARGSNNQNMVFHCHGRYDRPKSIIASEADYQRWYVAAPSEPQDRSGTGSARETGLRQGGGRESEGQAFIFRQTMNLLFRSNPLLFIGYGLREPDLLQPLRELGAIDPVRKKTHPVFALRPSRETPEDEHQEEALFERYGVHVIPYPESPDTDPRSRGAALCDALRGLKEKWDEAREDWVRKPVVRRPDKSVSKRDPLLIPRLDAESNRSFEVSVPDRIGEILGYLQAEKRPNVIGLIGSSGSGKSWHALRLIERLRNESHDFHGIFYWNTHYANEAITALDFALAYLDPQGETSGTREERLLQCLEMPYLLIVDGCERLLRPDDQPGEGRAYGSGFRTILEAMTDSRSRTTVVLSGRLWPSELTPLSSEREGKIVKLVLEKVRTEELAKCPPFDSLPRESVSALVSLLNGHSFGLLLAGRFLARVPARERLGRARELQRRLAEPAPQRRVDTMIEKVLKDVDNRTQGLGRELVEHLSLFIEPVLEQTVQTCFESACEVRGVSATPELCQQILAQLTEDHLVLRMQDAVSRSQAYSAYPVVRDHLRRNELMARPSVLPDFSLTAYTAGTNGVDPGPKRMQRTITRIYDRLLNQIEELRKNNAEDQARKLCRDAYGLLRSHMEASSAARWSNFTEYMLPGIRLTSLVKEVSGSLWSFCDPNELKLIESPQGPLFIGELAWLYNDVGLALFCEGLMQDAYAVWEQGYEINRVLEATAPYGEFVLESQLNLTHVLIELGKVADAAEYLERASRLNIRLRNEEAEGRILGYQGFLEHIRGNLQTADDLYQNCRRRVRRTGNLRATSFFLTLHAGIKIELDELDEAEKLIRSSRAAAESGAYPDLVAYSRVPGADLLKKKGELTRARLEYDAARREAQSHRAQALEALILFKLGDISLEQGDAEGARRLSLQSLNLSNQLGLGLITTRALMILARAMLRAGQRELGVTYLKIVQQRARVQQYILRVREAEKFLQEEGITDLPSI